MIITFFLFISIFTIIVKGQKDKGDHSSNKNKNNKNLKVDSNGLATIWETIRFYSRKSNPQFRALGALIQSPCFKSTGLLDSLNNSSLSMTLWAPLDSAFGSFFSNPTLFRGGDYNCSSKISRPVMDSMEEPFGNDREEQCEKSDLFKKEKKFDSMLPCFPSIIQYHFIPNRTFYLLDDLNGIDEILTPLKTGLGGRDFPSSFVRQSSFQILIVNQIRIAEKSDAENGGKMNSKANLNYGISHANVVLRNLICSNGIIHGIDKVMTPPANLTRTLKELDKIDMVAILKSQDDFISNLYNVTIFLPEKIEENENGDPLTPEQIISKSSPPILNLTYYTFKGRFYDIDTAVSLGLKSPYTVKIANLAGQEMEISYDRNYRIKIDGIPISRSNILLDVGVLHFIEKPIPRVVKMQGSNLTITNKYQEFI